jgi:hypothetical protein
MSLSDTFLIVNTRKSLEAFVNIKKKNENVDLWSTSCQTMPILYHSRNLNYFVVCTAKYGYLESETPMTSIHILVPINNLRNSYDM